MGKRPPYADIFKNRSDRAALCKICINAHILIIERGRHLNIPRNERYCSICNSGQIENQKNFLLHCEKHVTKICSIKFPFLTINCVFMFIAKKCNYKSIACFFL